jgi:hypothetical protein
MLTQQGESGDNMATRGKVTFEEERTGDESVQHMEG